MPPKKAVAKGAKGKAKAQDKEEKKSSKLSKSAPKGTHYPKFISCLYNEW